MARIATQPGKEDKFKGKASDIIDIDDKEEDEFGQNVRDTYPKADYFANLMSPNMERDIQRFVHLLFGHSFHTPSPDEYAMYHANAVSLRSSDDNRQVGAIIFNIDDPLNLNNLRKADVIAVGTNEVPRGGGGLYWEDATPDARDQALLKKGENRADEIKVSALAELIDKIRDQQWFNDTISTISATKLAKELLPNLKGTQFRDIGEFSRPVHAEMAALIDAARRGVAVDGHSMYVTTFPCHNCAKHIIAAGIQRVVYLEPYPKSRAGDLYAEEIVLEAVPGKEERNKVNFIAYSGVAPRQYQQLFSMSQRGAKKGKSLNTWTTEQRSLVPIYVPQNASLLYLVKEKQELKSLTTAIYSINRTR
jgi:cytidine deaminase